MGSGDVNRAIGNFAVRCLCDVDVGGDAAAGNGTDDTECCDDSGFAADRRATDGNDDFGFAADGLATDDSE